MTPSPGSEPDPRSTPRGERRLAVEIGGAFLAGDLYGVTVGAELRVLPVAAVLAMGVLGGIAVATPFALVGWLRRRRSGDPGMEPSHALARGFLNALGLLVGVESIVYGALRFVFRTAGLVEVTDGRILAGGLGGVLGAFALIRGGEFLLGRLPFSRVSARTTLATALGVVSLLGSLAGLFRKSPEERFKAPPVPPGRTAPRLVILGIDGLGENVFRRFSSSMANLDRFRASAATGTVDSRPPFLSAAIWTSIATGLPWTKHGVTNFELYFDDPSFGTVPIDRLYTDPLPGLFMLPAYLLWKKNYLALLPPTRLHRSGTPFWMEKEAGRVGIVCWPATWPAEPVPGALVTDRWAPDKAEVLYHNRLDLPAQVYPPGLASDLAPLRRRAGEAPDPELEALAPLKPEEEAQFLWGTRWTGKLPKNEPFSNPYYGWLGDRSCLSATRAVENRIQPDLLAVYLLGADLTEHVMMPDETGQLPGFDAADSARLSSFMPGYLEALDREIAWVLSVGDSATTTVFISDHGMTRQSNSLFGNWHAGPGLIFIRGPHFHPGQDLGALPPEQVSPLLTGILSGS